MSPCTLRAATAADLPAVQALLGRTPESTAGRLVAVGADGSLQATLRLQAGVGLDVPRCWYHVGTVVHAAAELELFRPQRTLLLGHDLTGAAELSDMAAAGDDIALAALVEHAVATLPGGSTVFAELPGARDADGTSPFWQGLTRHFFRGDAADALARLGPAWHSQLAALLPRQLIYAAFLSEPAQGAIGRELAAAGALRRMLEAAGFAWQGHTTIDDAAPVLERTIRR